MRKWGVQMDVGGAKTEKIPNFNCKSVEVEVTEVIEKINSKTKQRSVRR